MNDEADKDGAGASTRREVLRASSLGGIALFMSGYAGGSEPKSVEEPDDEVCASQARGPDPDDEEFRSAAEEMWAAFDEGTLVWDKTKVVELDEGLKQDREEFHGAFLKGNWSTWTRCKRLTKQCAWNTGLIAAMLREHHGQSDKISKKEFEMAARAVKDMQRRRAKDPSNFTGIAC